MGHERKARMFQLLFDMGFKEIEIGFPSASQTDFDFARWAIEAGGVPDGVSLQVLVQCRPELISRTFEALEGARKPIVHFYNSTSELQRRVVFAKDVAGIKQIATDAAKMITDMAAKAAAATGSSTRPRASPAPSWRWRWRSATRSSGSSSRRRRRSSSSTCRRPSRWRRPTSMPTRSNGCAGSSTVATALIVSLHPHNDRGTGIAATELGLMAGADRVEGTLFGNGERTGNVDIVTLALNMYTQGLDPKLDCSDITRIKDVYEYSNQLKIPERHPYVGELVYTAFSGSHQDAINKGMKAIRQANTPVWEVPYLPIDPQDVGRTYEAIIRINSQSGKGGIAYVMHADYGLNLPRNLQIEFSHDIQAITDAEGKEVPSKRIYERFLDVYVDQPGARLKFVDHQTYPDTARKGCRVLEATIIDGGREMTGDGLGHRSDRRLRRRAVAPHRRAAFGARLFRAFHAARLECRGRLLHGGGASRRPHLRRRDEHQHRRGLARSRRLGGEPHPALKWSAKRPPAARRPAARFLRRIRAGAPMPWSCCTVSAAGMASGHPWRRGSAAASWLTTCRDTAALSVFREPDRRSPPRAQFSPTSPPAASKLYMSPATRWAGRSPF